MGRLDGKVAIVTGSSRGIGRAVAMAFGQQGAGVTITGVQDENALHAVEAEIASLDGDVLAAMTDVSERKEVDTLVDRVMERFGRIDILVNNAGILRHALLDQMTEDQWDETIRVHLKGTFNCTQAVLPAMKGQNGGKIINVAAPSALRGHMGVSDYAAAKGGIIAFTKNAASELQPHNIQVNCISPVANTRMTDQIVAFQREQSDGEPARPPRGRLVPPEAVAPAFVFFACSDSDYVTGQVLAFHD